MFPLSSVSHRASQRARVEAIKEVAPAYYQVRLEAAQLAETARPGQFVHILTTPNAAGWSFDPLLRRAFSIMGVSSPDKNCVDLLFRVEGRGTAAFAQARVGDEIELIGPLGRPFDISPFGFSPAKHSFSDTAKSMFHVKQYAPSAIVVGGGVGVPPLVYLSNTLASLGVNVYSIIGARNTRDVIGWHELSAVCQQVSITTDDGSRGHYGRVTDLLVALFEKSSRVEADNTVRPVVYACGPFPMLRAVAQICMAAQIRCQVSLEENMPCGIGVCNGCVVRTRQPFSTATNIINASDERNLDVNRVIGSEWSPYQTYRRVCVEGPACWADEIDWEHQG